MKKAQNLLEYVLIVAMVAVVFGYAFVGKMDFKKLKNYVFIRPASTSDPSKINIEAMTDVN